MTTRRLYRPGVRLSLVHDSVDPIVIDSVDGEGLRVDFRVTKTSTLEASTAEIGITGLSQRTRDRISGITRRVVDFSNEFVFQNGRMITGADLGGSAELVNRNLGFPHVRLEAGWDGASFQVFEGGVINVRTRRFGTDRITRIECGDGVAGQQRGHANRVFSPGTPLFPVVDYLRRTMGAGRGNLTPARLSAVAGDRVNFSEAFVCTGLSRDLFGMLFRLLEVDAFIDDGELYMVRRGETLPGDPVKLAIGSGLLESPIRLEDDRVAVVARFHPGLRPGAAVVLASREVKGSYRVERVQHEGSSRGGGLRSMAELQDMSTVPGVI